MELIHNRFYEVVAGSVRMLTGQGSLGKELLERNGGK